MHFESNIAIILNSPSPNPLDFNIFDGGLYLNQPLLQGYPPINDWNTRRTYWSKIFSSLLKAVHTILFPDENCLKSCRFGLYFELKKIFHNWHKVNTILETGWLKNGMKHFDARAGKQKSIFTDSKRDKVSVQSNNLPPSESVTKSCRFQAFTFKCYKLVCHFQNHCHSMLAMQLFQWKG